MLRTVWMSIHLALKFFISIWVSLHTKWWKKKQTELSSNGKWHTPMVSFHCSESSSIAINLFFEEKSAKKIDGIQRSQQKNLIE